MKKLLTATLFLFFLSAQAQIDTIYFLNSVKIYGQIDRINNDTTIFTSGKTSNKYSTKSIIKIVVSPENKNKQAIDLAYKNYCSKNNLEPIEKSQLDTIELDNGKILKCKVLTLDNDYFSMEVGDSKITKKTLSIKKIVINSLNPNKKPIESAYLSFLNNRAVVISVNPQPKIVYSAGHYLNRGAKRQLRGIVFTIGGALIGGALVALPNYLTPNFLFIGKLPTLGGVVAGGAGLTGMCMFISGIVDYKKAGRIMDSSKN
jgi:hypothetical protein